MGSITLLLTLISCFYVAGCAPSTSPPLHEENGEDNRRSPLDYLSENRGLADELLGYPEKAREQLYRILSLNDPLKKVKLLIKWSKLYKAAQSSKLSLNSLLKNLKKGKREKFLRTIEYEYGRPSQASHKTKVKYSRKVQHFNNPRPSHDLISTLMSERTAHKNRRDLSGNIYRPPFDYPLDNFDADFPEHDDLEFQDELGTSDEKDDFESLKSNESDGSGEDEVLPLLEDFPLDDDEDAVSGLIQKSNENNHKTLDAANSDSSKEPRESSALDSLLRPSKNLPRWLIEDEIDGHFPEDIDLLPIQRPSKNKYYEIWKLLHPECQSLDCVPKELWPDKEGTISIDYPTNPSGLRDPNCEYLGKLMVKLWKRLSVYLGSHGQPVPPTPDLKKILFLINLYLKISKEQNLSHQPIKAIIYQMYKILSRYPNWGIDNIEFPEVDGGTTTDVDIEVDIEHLPPSLPHLTKEQLLKIIIEYYRHDRQIPNRYLQLIIRTLLLEIIPDFNKPLRTRCEQRAVAKLFKSVSYALKAYLNKEECRYERPRPRPLPHISDLLIGLSSRSNIGEDAGLKADNAEADRIAKDSSDELLSPAELLRPAELLGTAEEN